MTNPQSDPARWSDTQAWLDDLDRPTRAAHLGDSEPDPLPTELDIDDRPHDLDAATPPHPPTLPPSAETPTPTVPVPSRQPPRFSKPAALTFAAVTVVATITVTGVLLAMRTEHHAVNETTTPTTQISVLPPAPSPTPTDDTDTPIPFTASASCPPGSTAPQAVAGDDPSRAWVCVRNGADGQVLHLDLGRTMVITAVSLTPGWVGTDASGADQWPAHRVVTRMQWIFNDDAATVVTQTTGNVHGPAVQPVPHRGVLASKVTAVILETSRPPGDPAPTTTAAPGGLLDTVLGPPATPPADPVPPPHADPLPPLTPPESRPDPADTTVAVSSIKILGHPPQ